MICYQQGALNSTTAPIHPQPLESSPNKEHSKHRIRSESGFKAFRSSPRLNVGLQEKVQLSWSRSWSPPAELRQPLTASQPSETEALSLVSAGMGCFNPPCVSPVKAVSDQRGSSTPRHGCHSPVLLGNGILKPPIIWQP